MLGPEDIDPIEEQRSRRQQDTSSATPRTYSTSSGGVSAYQYAASSSSTASSSRTPSYGTTYGGVATTSYSYASYTSGGSSSTDAYDYSTERTDSKSPEGSVRLTPVTRKVSKAKKGQPVHVCNQCEPPKVSRGPQIIHAIANACTRPSQELNIYGKPGSAFYYMRHGSLLLRRHILGHDEPKYPCTYRGCDKSFHRSDLLSRHLVKQ